MMPMSSRTDGAPRPGLIPRLWRAVAGERDPVDAQLRELARQGAAMARLAHASAFALLILFSLGSLVALSAEALAQVLNDWQTRRQVDIPAGISVAVSTLLVTCMDTAALYAASMLRVLAARGAPAVERRLHTAVLAIACALESGTYLYMGALYDHPASVAAWALIVARAAAAPLFAVYLSLARPLPVGPRDILHGVEMASGAGVLRDTVTIAADPAAPLAQKAAIFNASAIMAPADRQRLAGLLAVVAPADHAPGVTLPAAAPIAQIAPPGAPGAPEKPPTGPGSPSAQPAGYGRSSNPTAPDGERGGTIRLVDPQSGQRRKRRAVSAERRIRRLLASEPDLGSKEIARRLRVSDSTASKWRGIIAAERGRGAAADGGTQRHAQ